LSVSFDISKVSFRCFIEVILFAAAALESRLALKASEDREVREPLQLSLALQRVNAESLMKGRDDDDMWII
jgi:hypothetical protein